ncbi:serine/threonine-protein kinase OXI1-like [Impatiens glandulifera]|uniref:serine/threonine-protein kinase OXI1-like n=1 Tax=Impatiens glandulifera TaxID=253017 RepID=UPI001FB140A0|nr:serine/threonine-protein kinase OXI1-like [Impatiens glandulifera]
MEDNYGIPILDIKVHKVISPLGRGAKGVVFLLHTKTESPKEQFLALKVVSKSSIEEDNASRRRYNKEYKTIHLEKEILSSLHHPLLPKLQGLVETERIIGYAIDYCPGGNLHSLRKKQTEKMFSDNIIRFYAAELVLALEYLHGLGFVYRDLKPENIMIQENGHLMLIDFDLSTKLPVKPPQSIRHTTKQSAPETNKKKKQLFRFQKYRNSGISPEDDSTTTITVPELASIPTKSNSFVGTEEYIAPEIIQGNGHDFAVDWWCLGIVLYEMLYGITPFKGTNRKDTFNRILHKSPCLVGETTFLRDLIEKLLEKDPMKRLGIEEIKRHDFFKGVDWELIGKISRPPYLPIEEEEMKENGEIDVERFVQRVFEEEEMKEKERTVIDHKKNVQELNQLYEPNPFLVF